MKTHQVGFFKTNPGLTQNSIKPIWPIFKRFQPRYRWYCCVHV